MVKNCLGPGHVIGEVAVFTLGRETGGDVIGIPRCLVIGLVAAIAVLGKIVSAGMAFGAIQGAVSALQRPDQVMVKDRSLPGNGFKAVTDLAVGGKSGLQMVGFLDLVVFIQMTGYTLSGGSRIYAIPVTAGADSGSMAAVQRKTGMAVIGHIPGGASVAEAAVGRELGGQVVGFGGIVVIFLMAVETVVGQSAENIVFVTLGAVQDFMGSLEGETRFLFMIPGPGPDRFPVMRGMAVSAVKSQLQVVTVVFFADPVAGFTTGRGALQNSLQVAVSAGYGPVLSDQRKIGLVMGNGIPFFFLGLFFRVKGDEQ